jgi:hypothetical protein
LIHNALALLFISAGRHRPSELGSNDKRPATALAYVALPAPGTSTTHSLTYRKRLEIREQDFGELALKYSDGRAVSENHQNWGKITLDQLGICPSLTPRLR